MGWRIPLLLGQNLKVSAPFHIVLTLKIGIAGLAICALSPSSSFPPTLTHEFPCGISAHFFYYPLDIVEWVGEGVEIDYVLFIFENFKTMFPTLFSNKVQTYWNEPNKTSVHVEILQVLLS